MKKSIVLLVLLLIISGCSKNEKQYTSLMDYGDYQKINEENIKKIEIVRYTEGGDLSETVEDDLIVSTYNNLKNKKIGKETNRTCEDNTTVYIFTLADDTKMKIVIECGWVIIDNKRFILE